MGRLAANQLTVSVSEGEFRRPVLVNLDMEFPTGAMTGLTGASGSGKTTLLSTLSLLVPPDAGSIFYDDLCLTGLAPDVRDKFRRDHHALVFQTLRLIDVFTITEHLEHVARRKPDPPSVLAAGMALLEKGGIADKAQELPRRLSGGERQRAALAIALCGRPSIVLADEPTAALDEANSRFVANTLREYAEGGAIVVSVSHDPILLQGAHAILELNKL